MPPAPVVVPNTVPQPIRSQEAPASPSGRGPLVGRGGPLRGIEPAYTDPRVWAPLDAGPAVVLSPKQRIDSVIASRIQEFQDSIRIADGSKRDPTDWTFEKGGQKWGMDSKYIRLGPLSIPTALLGLLPMNNAALQGNVFAAERARQQNAWSREIAEQAQRAMNEDEFRTAVKRLRERKERERQAKKAEETVAGRGESP